MIAPEALKAAFAALLMGISAAATAAYAYLIGPLLKSLFSAAAPPDLPEVPVGGDLLTALTHRFQQLDPLTVGAAVVAVAAIKSAAYFGSSALTVSVGQRILHRLRTRLYRGLTALNPLDPRTQNAGEWTVRFTADTTQTEEAISKGILSAVHHLAQVIALAALALSLDPALALMGLVAFPPATFLILKLGKKIRVRRKAVHEHQDALGTAMGETVAGLTTIRAFDMQQALERRFAGISNAIARSVTRAALLRAASAPLNELLAASALAGTLVWAAHRIAEGGLAPEAFISFFSALFLLYQPIKGLGQAHHAVAWGTAALDRITPFLRDTPPAPPPSARPAPPLLRLENATAGYDGTPVLFDLCLTVRPGERIAVVGPSGSGKTTLIQLLLGLIPLRAGRYRFDDRPFESDDRIAFAPVGQEPFLFDDSILENVRVGAPTATDAAVAAACDIAGVSSFSADLPQGLQSRTGPFGRFLSVGQRQRVCLARALMSGAPVLLLDEVTASVDGETEQSMVDGLQTLPKERTILIVTHRLSTARRTDRIVLIENGTVAADGPSATLLRDPRISALFGGQTA